MATDMFLDFEKEKGLEGESADVKHAETIEISSWSTSYEQPMSPAKTATGPSVERCKAEPITIAKLMDASTPGLLKRIWSGKLIPKGTIHCYRADDAGKPVLYLKIEMLHILVTTYSLGGAEGDIPQEEVGLSVGQVTFHYDVQKKEGGGTGAKKAQCNFITGKID
jgi:type VI secretion system secreted protein Hcp